MEQAGYCELSHTADRALMVWGSTVDELFLQAARGMYQLMCLKPLSSRQYYRNISISAEDQEGLLVSFLSELLYLVESEHLFFDNFIFFHENQNLKVCMVGCAVLGEYREVKAVTYNKLEIQKKEGRYETTIVFDI